MKYYFLLITWESFLELFPDDELSAFLWIFIIFGLPKKFYNLITVAILLNNIYLLVYFGRFNEMNRAWKLGFASIRKKHPFWEKSCLKVELKFNIYFISAFKFNIYRFRWNILLLLFHLETKECKQTKECNLLFYL